MNVRALMRRAFPYLIVAVGGFLVAYVLLFVFAFPADILPDEGQLPNVVGMAYDDASGALEKAGFHAQRGETRIHRTAPQHTVLQQDPPAGSRQKRGINVVLAVSAGQRTGTMPEILGLTEQQARLAIENAGFQIGHLVQETSSQSRGVILRSRPAGGETVPLPATVALVISQGPATVQMPSLVGHSLPQARAMLEQLGLRVAVVRSDTSSYQPENTIINQIPAAGATVSAGGAVNLAVSRYPPPAPVFEDTYTPARPLPPIQPAPPTPPAPAPSRPITTPPRPTPPVLLPPDTVIRSPAPTTP